MYRVCIIHFCLLNSAKNFSSSLRIIKDGSERRQGLVNMTEEWNRVHSWDLDFESIVRDHESNLQKYILSLVRQKELAEDICQEVLISAYLSFSSIKERSKIKSWLYKIAMNKCRDYWRKEKTIKKFWQEKLYHLHCYRTLSPMPEETLLNKCTRDEIAVTINALPEIYRDPLLLFYYNDCSLLEISHYTKLPLSTVKTRMKRAKDQLRPKMNRTI
jgi:RNA polymerase sigma factor (sigma-70 family)